MAKSLSMYHLVNLGYYKNPFFAIFVDSISHFRNFTRLHTCAVWAVGVGVGWGRQPPRRDTRARPCRVSFDLWLDLWFLYTYMGVARVLAMCVVFRTLALAPRRCSAFGV
jgi:hypothetical protein